jgi:8-oxo-(d)GTP phosphatase
MAGGVEGAVARAATILDMTELVRAAGGVVLRTNGAGSLVALVHRPRYDDWSFPKGKLDEGEDFPTAAVREVEEETGLRCTIVRSVGAVTYLDRHGRPKVVRYFAMDPDGGTFVPGDEVDELRWVPADDAGDLLTYDHDRNVLDRALARVTSGVVYLLRHAKAGRRRSAGEGPDEERPLTRRGRKQALRLVERTQGVDLERIVSSPFTRCVQTVEPLAQARGIELEIAPELAEGQPLDDVERFIGSLAPVPTLLCAHGPEIAGLIERLEAAGVPIGGTRGLAKGSKWVLERGPDGRVRSARYIPAPNARG